MEYYTYRFTAEKHIDQSHEIQRTHWITLKPQPILVHNNTILHNKKLHKNESQHLDFEEIYRTALE